ncbi:MAG TPA: HD domain-containing protein [Candidatus Hydrogenedens sp.]|nr:HD domain-containing protein [Candidatus Hydrogenedens sp.]HOK10100.1 HD domain-containing protein [Candidatus Hydrogenedens sp.]HOL19609.1 HD domain-containing protein [Candidatus Hydrogenedens sp.]HPP59351.1 HD domain-containing protein [Candidatus Hydrogenedens sp.]
MIQLDQKRVLSAIDLALMLHKEQKRKGRDIPYITHLLAVASKILEEGGDEDQFIAGLLHDSIEDQNTQWASQVLDGVEIINLEIDEKQFLLSLLTNIEASEYTFTLLGVIFKNFGKKVALYVRHCSDSFTYPKKPWKQRKQEFISQCYYLPPEVKLIVACDKWHNLYTTYLDLCRGGDNIWEKFNGGKEGSLWYYREIIHALKSNWTHPILLELQRYYLYITEERI